MSDPFADRQLPKGVLMAAAGLVVATLATVGAMRAAGVAPLAPEASPAVMLRELRFTDLPDGAVGVIDARDGRQIAVLEPGQDGFARATLRTFARERRNAGIGPEAPLVLASRADGRITLDDPATGRHVDLEAFGPAAAGAFLRLLAPTPSTTVSATASTTAAAPAATVTR